MADLIKLLGLSETECECYGDAPEGYSDSETGYFIDEEENGIPIKSAVLTTSGCGPGSVWESLESSRKNAIRDFKVDLFASLYSSADSNVKLHDGLIGKPKATTTVGGNYDKIGRQITIKDQRRGGFYEISTIFLGLNISGSYTLTISSNSVYFEEQERTLTAVAGKFEKNDLSEPLIIPFFQKDTEGEDLEYYLTIDVSNGAKALDNKIKCCGAELSWAEHMDVHGIGELSGHFGFSKIGRGNGLATEGFFNCYIMDWLCSEVSIKGEKDTFNMKYVVGRTLQYRAASIMIAKMVASDKVQTWGILTAKQLSEKRKWLLSQYKNYIDWIATKVPEHLTDCFKCKEEDQIFVNEILN